MNDKICPQCGISVTEELPGGLCPACLMAAARQSQDGLTETYPSLSSNVPPSLKEISRLFPELEVIQLVGQGGMGAVYKVRQKNLDRIVALKVFLNRKEDAEFAVRFQREARALAKLNHPNIVTVHDFGIRETAHFLIMEFIDGLNLRQVSVNKNLSPELALQMVPQLCDALQYAHDQGVIHRDIKPENLLLDNNGQINIADFGLAKLTNTDLGGSLTRTQQVMGTLNYMAPEQRERPTEVDHRADIYSLGVVIYELLTGELPLGRFQPPSDVSNTNERIDPVVMRALEKDPDRRFQQADQFKTGFAVASATATAPPNGESMPLKRAAPLGVPVAPVKSYDQPTGTRCMFTFLSSREKKGNWIPGDPQLIVTVAGDTLIDLTDVHRNRVELTVCAFMGNVVVIVPHGATVDLDGFIFLGATADNIVKSQTSCQMNVRIHSWGAMGMFEVRTPEGIPVASTANQQAPPIKPSSESRSTLSDALVLLYQTFAILISFALPAIYLMGKFDILPESKSMLWLASTAIGCGFIWAGLGYFQILVGSRSNKSSEGSARKYVSSSKIATLIRFLGLFFGFISALFFVLVALDKTIDVNNARFAAIASGILCGVAFTIAPYIERFVTGNSR